MRYSTGLALIAGFLIASAAPLEAQTTIQKARDILNDRTPPPPPARVEPPVVVETERRTTVIVPRREVVIIERVQARHAWWKHPKYRSITVYYDGRRFYRHPFDRRVLRKVVVYERAGRYYIDEVQWRRDHRRWYHRDYDGWSRDDRRHRDDKWRDDDRWRDDDKRKDDDKDKGDNGWHLGRDHDKDNR